MGTILDPLERDISRTKRELNDLFRAESLAWRQGNAAEGHARHLALLEKELENIGTIARYVEPISPVVARDLRHWHAQMTIRFHEIRNSRDPGAVQRWVTQDLVPHLRDSEQIAHVLATSVRRSSRGGSAPYAWPVRGDAPAKGRDTGAPRDTRKQRL